MSYAEDLRAPGVRDQKSERDQAIDLARRVINSPASFGDDMQLLARQFLRFLGISERG